MNMKYVLCIFAVLCSAASFGEEDLPITVDADFPGGNIIVDRMEGDTVYLQQELRDTEGWWFYWYFRVSGAAGKTLRFQFSGRDPIGVRGPAVSVDDGINWAWLGADSCADSAFTYTFPNGSSVVRFAFTMPYLESDWQRFLNTSENPDRLVEDILCTSSQGRNVELLRVGQLNGEPQHRVVLTARHHACESMASFVLEGLLTAILVDNDDGRWFQNHLEVLVVPFMDKDGVENGDQGKNRKPHDHNRDYGETSIYPETKALRAKLNEWAGGRLHATLDLHCPWIRGNHNEEIYLVGSADEAVWEQQQRFGAILEEVNQGPLPYRASSNLPFGQSWNTTANWGSGKSSQQWMRTIEGVHLATTIEVPYANVMGVEVTPESARAFGVSLSKALRIYLEKS